MAIKFKFIDIFKKKKKVKDMLLKGHSIISTLFLWAWYSFN